MTNNERFPFNNIDPTALIEEGVEIGTGNIIGPYCVIGFAPEWKGHEHKTGQVVIGNNNRITGLVTIDSGANNKTVIRNNCYIMKHAHIGHDAIINDNVTLSCGVKIGGHTIIEDRCNLGLNSVVHQKQRIQEGCMIGMGAVVTKKLVTVPYCKYVGNPAKFLSSNEQSDYTHFMRDTI